MLKYKFFHSVVSPTSLHPRSPDASKDPEEALFASIRSPAATSEGAVSAEKLDIGACFPQHEVFYQQQEPLHEPLPDRFAFPAFDVVEEDVALTSAAPFPADTRSWCGDEHTSPLVGAAPSHAHVAYRITTSWEGSSGAAVEEGPSPTCSIASPVSSSASPSGSPSASPTSSPVCASLEKSDSHPVAAVGEPHATTDDNASSSPTKRTNAVNRSISDLHQPTWLGLIAMNTCIRVSIFHPLQLALARKRVMQEKPPSAFKLMRAAMKGGVQRLPGGKTSIDFGPGGLRSLYRGYGAAFCSGVLGSSVYLFTMENMKEKFTKAAERARLCRPQDGESTSAADQDEELFKGHRFACAAGAMCADALTISIVTPIAVVVGRQMTSGVGLAKGNPYRSIPGTVKHLWGLHQPKAEEKLRQIALRKRNSAVGHGVLSTTDTVKKSKKLATSSTFEGSTASRSSTTLAASSSTKLATSSPTGAADLSKVHPLQRGFWRTVYGVRGMYQGMSVALLRVPFAGVWWGTYTTAKEKLYSTCSPILERWEAERNATHHHHAEEGGRPSIWKRNLLLSPSDNLILNALASAFSSAMTTMLVNPMSVMQIRLQSMPHDDTASAAGRSSTNAQRGVLTRLTRKRTGLIGVASNIIRKEGIRGFYKGTSTNIGIAIMDGIVFSLLFEVTKMISERGVALPTLEEKPQRGLKEEGVALTAKEFQFNASESSGELMAAL